MIKTPSLGQKWQKRVFFLFFQFKIHQNVIDLRHGNKNIEGIKGQKILFKKHKILYCKNCHESQGGSKLSKFKSKKQTFMDF